MSKIVIGLGTGRCGTRSFSHLLNSHPEITSGHEQYYLLWQPDINRMKESIEQLQAKSQTYVIADVGFYWLIYVDAMHNLYPDTKFICLWREREKVVQSYCRSNINPMYTNLIMVMLNDNKYPTKLSEYVTQTELDNMDASTREWVDAYWDEPMLDNVVIEKLFPAYDIKDRFDYVGKYWDHYYQEADKYQDKYPDNFLVVDMDFTLNTDWGKERIFNFIGVSPNTLMH